jgi:hypothetical protein
VPRIVALAVLVVLAACHPTPPPAAVAPAQEQLDPEVIHARGTAILACYGCRPIPAGDTFVTWTPKPDYYTTVSRTDSTVASSLVSTYGVIGTAEAVWQGGLQREVNIRWTRSSATLMEVSVRFEAGVIHLAGMRDTALQTPSPPWAAAGHGLERQLLPLAGVLDAAVRAPSLPWAVADYGMEDQLLPLIETACVGTGRRRLAIYRPSLSKWDTITIVCRRTQGATLATVTEPDGEHVLWTITPDGALVRLTRDRHPNVERRPLEMSRRMADYVSLRQLWER